MQHLTIVRKKRGPFTAVEVELLGNRIVQHGPYPDNVTNHLIHVSEDQRSAAFWYTNEVDGPVPVVEEKRVIYALGYPIPSHHELTKLEESPNLHRAISMMNGRFSSAIFNLKDGNSAAAVPIARLDAIYHAESNDLSVIGNWSGSVSAAIQQDSIAYEDEKLFGFLNSGHFIADETFYKGVSALPGYSTVLIADDRLTVNTEIYQLIIESIESSEDDHYFDAIAEAMVSACHSANDLDRDITLNLSGGKDSRLLLAAFQAAGYKVHGRTYTGGSSNSSDVYVAKMVAAAAGITHETVPYALSPLHGAMETEVDFYTRTHSLLRASDASVVAWVNQSYSPRFRNKIVLNGLGGELMRGGHASKSDQVALALKKPETTIMKRWGKFSKVFRPDLQQDFASLVQSWMERVSPHKLNSLEVADFAYLVTKLGRWGSAISRPGEISHKSFYPFLDNRLTTLIYKLPPRLRVGDHLIYKLTDRFNTALTRVPIAYDAWKCHSEEENAWMRKNHPDAFVPRGTQNGPNTDWRMNWLQLLPEFKRQYLDCADQSLRDMVDDAHVLKLLDGAATNNDRYLLFSIYAASIMRSGGLERDTEKHPLVVTL